MTGKDKGGTVRIKLGVVGVIMILIGVSSGYVNGGINGLLAGLIISVLAILSAVLGIIPVAGVGLYIYIMKKMRETMQVYISLAGNVTFTIEYWLGLVSAIIITLVMTVLIVSVILSKKYI